MSERPTLIHGQKINTSPLRLRSMLVLKLLALFALGYGIVSLVRLFSVVNEAAGARGSFVGDVCGWLLVLAGLAMAAIHIILSLAPKPAGLARALLFAAIALLAVALGGWVALP